MNFDLEILRLIGWGLLVLLIIGFMLTEGLALGVTLLLPILGKTPAEKQHLLALMAPCSMSGTAWLIVLTAIAFAAWPIAYAVMLTSFYPVLLLMLMASVLRILLLPFCNAFPSGPWQNQIHNILTWGSGLAAALLGLLAGNVLKGIPFHLESDMRVTFLGDLVGMFNVFSLLTAASSAALITLFGAVFVQHSAQEALAQPAKAVTMKASAGFLFFFISSGLWLMHLEGYHISSEILTNLPSNPLAKFVKRGEGLWFDNYEHLPSLWLIPTSACLSVAAAMYLSKLDRAYLALLASSAGIVTAVLTFAFSLFPFLVPSNISLNSSLTIWDSSASQATLKILLWILAAILPLLAVLSRWLFSFFSNRPTYSQ